MFGAWTYLGGHGGRSPATRELSGEVVTLKSRQKHKVPVQARSPHRPPTAIPKIKKTKAK